MGPVNKKHLLLRTARLVVPTISLEPGTIAHEDPYDAEYAAVISVYRGAQPPGDLRSAA